MELLICNIVVCGVIFLAAVRGWRRGFTGQVGAVLGFAFGSVCAHIAAPELSPFIGELLPDASGVERAYVSSFLTGSVVYVAVYLAASALTRVIASAMNVFQTTLIDALFGSLFSIFNSLLLLSLVFNLILCMKPEGPLLDTAAHGDGNAVGEVLLLAPAVVGSLDVDDLHHAVQIREARKISQNLGAGQDVITIIDGERDLSRSPFIYLTTNNHA